MSGYGPSLGKRTLWAVAAVLVTVGAAVAAVRYVGLPGPEPITGPVSGGEGAEERGDSATEGRGPSGWVSVSAPDVSFPTLDGDTASLSGLRGQAVFLNFWATWCPPCKREIPHLVRLQDSLEQERATVVGVAVASGSRQKIRRFAQEYEMNYPVWISDRETAVSEYRAFGLPLTLLVDGQGVIRRRYLGPQTFEELSEDLAALRSRRAGPEREDSR